MGKKHETKAISLTVTEGLTVTILPSSDHEFLMSTKEVAIGYDVSPKTISGHLQRNPDDFVNGKHFLKGASISSTPPDCGKISSTLGGNLQPHQIFYTKRGVIRLGFFIKSDRARKFRDWAEDLIVHRLDEYAEILAEADIPIQSNPVLYDFETRVRTKLINGETYYKLRDLSLICGIKHTAEVMKKMSNLNNCIKITSDYWAIAEWWCTKEGVKQFLNAQKNRNMIRLHDTLFPSQLSLNMGR